VGQFYAKEDGFSGNVIVYRDGHVISNESYGLANVEWRIPATETTRFAICSETKQFTAASILLLQEQGLLHTTDKLSQHYPETPEAWKDVTLRQLLQHTSGIPDGVRISGTGGYDQGQRTPQEIVRSVATQPLVFPSGSRTEYNNMGYVMLGLVIEKVSGQTYAEFLQKHFFAPLNMQDSGLGSTTEVIPNKAYGYIPGKPVKAADPLPYDILYSAGGIYSTGADLAKWLIALHGGRVLKHESYDEMTTADPDGFGYGLKVSIQHGQKDIGHDGQWAGFISENDYFPATKTGLIVLTNQANGPSTPGTHSITTNLMALACDEHAIVRALGGEQNVNPAILQRYVGTYRSSDSDSKDTLQIAIVDHHLRLTPAGHSTSTLMAQAETRFYMKEWDGEAEFREDHSGVVTLDIFTVSVWSGFQLPTSPSLSSRGSLKTVTINLAASLMDFLHGASGRGDRELAGTRGRRLPVSGCSSRKEIRYSAGATVRTDRWKHPLCLSGLGCYESSLSFSLECSG
jgi:CubicO group peptidase (beta-lactamase class C family)